MQQLKTFEEWVEITKNDNPFLLFAMTDNCSVCHSLLPQVQALQASFPLPFYIVNAAESPEIAGQLSLFTAPVVLLFDKGREYARFARFVQMNELKGRMKELLERGSIID